MAKKQPHTIAMLRSLLDDGVFGTQCDLAANMGVAQSTVSRDIKSIYSISSARIARYIDACPPEHRPRLVLAWLRDSMPADADAWGLAIDVKSARLEDRPDTAADLAATLDAMPKDLAASIIYLAETAATDPELAEIVKFSASQLGYTGGTRYCYPSKNKAGRKKSPKGKKNP